jgi:hypothetical protein
VVLVHPNFSQVELNGTTTGGSFAGNEFFLGVGNAMSTDCHKAPTLTGSGSVS